MTGDEILDAMEHIDAELIEAADMPVKKIRAKPFWFVAVAAVLVLAIGIGTLAGRNNISSMTAGQTDSTVLTPVPIFRNLLAEPMYPKMEVYPNYTDYTDWEAYSVAYDIWLEDQRQQYNQPEGYADSLTDFFHDSIAQFLQGDGNPTYSPVNVYLAMAMLAETTGGNSQQQILDLFGVETIEQLREQASHMWNAHYCDDGQTFLLLANSLWLDDEYVFKKETAKLLANQYYAFSFRGDLGTEEMDEQLRTWLNTYTGGLLKEQTEKVELDHSTVFALASTVYFSAEWDTEFSKKATKPAAFHGVNGDIEVDFMHAQYSGHTFFWGENFGAIYLSMKNRSCMWLILPDEGFSVADILKSEEYLRMTMDPSNWENKRQYTVNLSMPKFDVVHQMDLSEGMRAMGVTDVFDSTIADFTPLTDTPSLAVSQINHAARVAVDEKGCIAAAFTVIFKNGGMPMEYEEIDFVLDRPFLFMISSRDNLPLFVGVVNEP